MLALGQGAYSATAVLAQLRDSTARVGAKFDILDRLGNVVGTIPVGDDGIEWGSAVVEYNAENEIKGQFRARMRPIAALRDQSFKRVIRPSYVVQMPDGGSVTYPLGQFIWITPEREVWPGDEAWEVILGDRTQLLDYGGPGPSGFSVAAYTTLQNAIYGALLGAGLGSEIYVPPASAAIPYSQTWSAITPRKIKRWQSQLSTLQSNPRTRNRRRAKKLQRKLDTNIVDQAPSTWLVIVNELARRVTYDQIRFNYGGGMVLSPVQDLSSATASFTFDCGASTGMITSTIETSVNYEDVANRVLVLDSDGVQLPYTSDANALFPTHPLRQANIGVYIDQITGNAGPGATARSTLGRKTLQEALGAYQQVSWDALLHPGVEIYDVLGLQVPGDPEFATTTKMHVRQIQFYPDAGKMSLQCSRVYA